MRKTAITFTVSALILGVFGAFLRWLQNSNAYDATGCLIPGNTITIVFLVYCIFAVVLIFAFTLSWLRRFACPKDSLALCGASVVPTALAWVCCVLFVLASVAIMFTAHLGRYPVLCRLLGAFGILAGVSFPFITGKSSSVVSMGRTASTVITLFYCFWLIYSYRVHANDPVIWNFAIEILAIASAATSSYYMAAFHFGGGNGTRALLALQIGIFFNVCTLFDNHDIPITVMFTVTIAVLMMLDFLVLSNLKDSREI